MCFKPDVIKKMNDVGMDTIFKFVVASQKDWEEITKLYIPIVDRE